MLEGVVVAYITCNHPGRRWLSMEEIRRCPDYTCSAAATATAPWVTKVSADTHVTDPGRVRPAGTCRECDYRSEPDGVTNNTAACRRDSPASTCSKRSKRCSDN